MHTQTSYFRLTLYCFFIVAAYLLTTKQRPRPPITLPVPTPASTTAPCLPRDLPQHLATSATLASRPSRPASFPPLTTATPDLQCRGMFTTGNGDQDTVMVSDDYYWELSRKLSPLLMQDVTDASSNILGVHAFSGTRLQLMNGSLPYLPCTVRLHSPTSIHK
ncbi:uncharacterized protein LOC123508066 [Portunus trituberculatus]|uniref:uncharacterized protein LOC123508066 n=1 Tax=Portunus trituberculatus TaxID=210409 RepID=UPI001E1D0947|nr:uncharacterized protein LOC123508066 [Portunus trituberculatus]